MLASVSAFSTFTDPSTRGVGDIVSEISVAVRASLVGFQTGGNQQ